MKESVFRAFFFACSLAALVIAVGSCTSVFLEYDKHASADYAPAFFPQPTNGVSLLDIYQTANQPLVVDEDDDNILSLVVIIPGGDPDAAEQITDAELDSLVVANRQSPIGRTGSFGSNTYHAYGVVVDFWRENSDGTRNETSAGRMYDPNMRSGFVMYFPTFPTPMWHLRTTAHELGHAFNLNHEDGDGTTLMTRSDEVDQANMVWRFSTASQEHLDTHDESAVWPGLGERHYTDHSEHHP